MSDSAEPLYTRFLRGLAADSRAPAVCVGKRSLTFEQVHEQALSWAGALLANAAEQPKAIGVLVGRSVEAYVGVLAALYAGAAVVPLRPDFPTSRTMRMLRTAEVSALVADGHGSARLPELRDAGLCAPTLVVGGDGDGTGSRSALRLRPEHTLASPRAVKASDIAYVLFTSGSTGCPKGVPITHANTAYYFRFLAGWYDFVPSDVFSQTFDLNFDCAMFDLFCAWGAGARVVSVPAHAYRDLPRFVAEQGLTVWFSTPSSIALVRRMGGLGAGSMPSLRWSFFAGEALKCEDADDWQRAAATAKVENLYGPTELTVTITAHRWSGERSAAAGTNGVVPLGRLHPGHSFLLVDPSGECSRDEGELWVTGPQMSPGYVGSANGRGGFVEHDGRTWYRTGDRVRLTPDGALAYLGRTDDQVQLHGWRVELAEIDHAVRACPGVDEVVTTGVELDDRTELVVFYTGVPTAVGVLARELAKTLPRAMLPQRFQHLQTLPLNPNRKTDRSELRARALELVSRSVGIESLREAGGTASESPRWR
jgi:amino acid adenylation domain-containing protein